MATARATTGSTHTRALMPEADGVSRMASP